MIKLEELIQQIKALHTQQQTESVLKTILIGIDGCGGSGKSTASHRLQQHLLQQGIPVAVVHMDDFYRPSADRMQGKPRELPVGAHYDWQRMLEQVLKPLRTGAGARYQRYDWTLDTLADWLTLEAVGVVIVEGVCATRLELESYYNWSVWVDTPRELRLARGLERDGEEARALWEEEWMVSEDYYVEQHRPRERASFIWRGHA